MQHTIVTLSRGDAHKIGEWVDYHARVGEPDTARLHHFKVPAAADLDIPYTIDDPVRLPG